MTLIKRKNIHPIFKCSDLATHITQSTRSTQWAQTSLAEADHYSHMATVKILRLGGERLPPSPEKKKKKKKFWIITCTTSWLCYSHYGVFCSFTHCRRSPGHSNFREHCIFWSYICTENLMLILSIVFEIRKSNRWKQAAERKKERKKE